MSVAIEIRGLSKSYRKVTAVDRVDLRIGERELFALLGVNGAGKSTLIKMLCGLLKPSGGDAVVLGCCLSQQPAALKAQINLSPQETAVAPNLTVRENLEFVAGIYGAAPRESREKAGKLIREFSMEEVEYRKAKTLSGGWQRRLSIAMALISQPKILFLDEPTLGLDVLARRELWTLIQRLKQRMTIILTTHYLEEAESLSDRIGIMAGGQLQAVGTVEELKDRYGKESLEEIFLHLAGGEGR